MVSAVAYSMSVTPYLGSLLSTQLFTPNTTIYLSAFGATDTGQSLTDASGTLTLGEQVTVGSRTLTVMGSGTAQPGIDLLGLIVPTGSAVDVILMHDLSGNLFFVYPQGVPNATSMVAMVLNIDQIGYSLTSYGPLCLMRGTRVATPDGQMRVECLRPGDLVMTGSGRALPVLWIGLDPRRFGPDGAAPHAPIRIPEGHFGPSCPQADLFVSPQHRILVTLEAEPEGTAHTDALVAAKHLCSPEICALRHCAHRASCAAMQHPRPTPISCETPVEVEYYAILLAQHDTLLAEGIEVESLLLGPMVLSQHPKLAALAPEATRACKPILKPGAARRRSPGRRRPAPRIMPEARQA